MQRKANQNTEAIYTTIKAYLAQHHYGPSVRDIADACHLSTSTVTRHLDFLVAQGYITRDPGRARSIRLQEKGEG